MPPVVAGFGEGLWSYLLTASHNNAAELRDKAEQLGLKLFELGTVTAAADITVADQGSISLSEIRQGYENYLPNLMKS